MVLQFVFFISLQTGSQPLPTSRTKAITAALATPKKASDWEDRSTLGISSESIRFLMFSSSCVVLICQKSAVFRTRMMSCSEGLW